MKKLVCEESVTFYFWNFSKNPVSAVFQESVYRLHSWAYQPYRSVNKSQSVIV